MSRARARGVGSGLGAAGGRGVPLRGGARLEEAGVAGPRSQRSVDETGGPKKTP